MRRHPSRPGLPEVPSAYRSDLARDDPRVDAAERAWAGRILGAGWLVGAGVLLLLVGLDRGGQPLTALLAVGAGGIGVLLLSGRGVHTHRDTFDALLLATTSTVGAAAVVLPEARQTLATCLVWVVPFACALLPPRRALLQVGYVVVVDGVVMVSSVLSGSLSAAAACAHWLLVTAIVGTVAVVVRRLNEHLHRRTQVAEAVAELGHRALTATEPDELLREALHVAVDVIGSDYSTALRQLPDGRFRVAAELGPDPIAPGTILLLAPTDSYARSVVQSGQPFVSADLSSDPRVTPPEPLLSRGVVSGLAVPVLGTREPLGVLALHSRRRRQFARAEITAATALAGVVATAWEQAEQRKAISFQAVHDSLTGLPNRALFLDRLEHALTRRSTGDPSASGGVIVLLIDLDDFKGVNDRHGHNAGDELLAAVAAGFLEAVRPEDTVARLGGDEFAVLCEHAPDEHAAARLVRRVQAAAAVPLAVEGGVVEVRASVGVALGQQPQGRQVTARTLLREADTALYTAKQQGRGHSRLYDERLQVQTRRRLQLESELRRGIDREEFVLHYQPIRSAADQHVLGVEALLRWNHPDRGLVLPGEFIPVAEQTGLILPLGRWVLHTACARAARWQQEQLRSRSEQMWVAVNVSPRQLDDPDLPIQVRTAMQRTGLVPGSLSLELTETALLDEGTAGVEALTTLRHAGAQLVLDDFGTGYSSLTHLTRFPIGALKVDGSFIAGLGRNARDSAVVSAVIALGSELGVKVIAEGVESSEQLSLLERTGCYGVQGFLLDQPSAEPSFDRGPRVSAR